MPLDVFPEFVPVQVEIQTEAPGLAPEQVEQLVTRPIEAAVNGAPDLAAMRSESIPGLSVVSLNFTDRADVYRARQGIAERVAAIGSALPAGVGTAVTVAAGLEHHGPAQDRPGVGRASIPTRCAIAPSGC